MPSARCKHGLDAAVCSMCRPTPKVQHTGPHLAARAILRCLECHSQLATEDANRTSLVGLLMRLRRDHSKSAHPEMSDSFSSADVELHCEVCEAEIGRLDVNTTSLGNELMAYRSDHERERHPY